MRPSDKMGEATLTGIFTDHVSTPTGVDKQDRPIISMGEEDSLEG
jgi:hypothetical protein